MAISDEELARLKNISVAQVQLLCRSRGTTNEALEALPEAAVRRALLRLDFPDLPTARGLFRLKQERSDDGSVRPHALGTAYEQTKALLSREAPPATAGVPTGPNGRRTGGRPAPTSGLRRADWVWLGPGNIGGRTRGLVIHPAQPDRMWAVSAGGGVWHTRDGGIQWDPVDDFLENLACACIASDPSDPSTMYVGTGEAFQNLDAIRGNGIFTTTDAVNWTPLRATQTPDFQFVSRIAVSQSGEVVLAATATGLFRSTDPARAVWTQVLDNPLGDVRFAPRDSSNAVAGSLQDGAAWFSRDGGLTWDLAVGGPWTGRVELAYAEQDPDVVYASVQMTTGQIWRSQDGGANYRKRKTLAPDGRPSDYLGGQGWYDNTIWAGDPTDADLVLAGGINLYRSTDGGDHLTEISTWWDPRSVHADQHAIVPHPAYDGLTNRTVFFGNDGGVFKADDLADVGTEPEPPFVNGWTELVNNYGVTQFYAGAGHPGSGKIIGGAQDNGSIVFDPTLGSQNWRQFFGGDGGWCASDPTDPDVFYGEYVFLNIHRNTDGATTDDTQGDRYISGQFFNFGTRDWDWKRAPFRITDAKNENALFIAPFVLDPNNENRILAGGVSLWRTDDAKQPNTSADGPTWKVVKPGAGTLISAIAVARGDSDAVWVGHEDGMVFRTANGTAPTPTWQRVGATGPNPLTPRRYCTCITVDPADPDTVYVAFGGYERGNLWVTKDRGASWTDLATALPPAPIRALAVHPRRTELLYCGTEVGLFASENAGASWSPTNEGPTNCSVDDLFWMDEVLVCVTHGRGMFRIDLSAVT
ncbi:WD40/YVTN/BNR-like repeat-containing protein [Streptomyces sp. NPDC059851]|uniref:WD40/YVTN/BNR-like repeat-containing protein n=1 Tax=Streptomyces sp. NPDC059851 TaxID=3346971 RepID=UPI003660A0A7